MNKTKLIISAIFFLTAIMLLIGCGKSEKDVTTNDKKTEKKEILDTTKFYSTTDSKYWQNYAGKGPDGNDMVEVRDASQVDKIKMAIMGHTGEDVYTCEMHPQVHQNYSGKCPVCKMDLIKQEKTLSSNTNMTHEEMDKMWQGKPNAIHKELKVPGTKCDNYKKIIEDALSKDKGVLATVVDVKEHVIHMYIDKTITNAENVEKIIQLAGFDVDNLKADPDAQKKLPECGK